MASFTSTQTGNWDDGGTWGNTSPGVAGTDYPGVTADTATIAAGHVVTYDSGDNSSVMYGNITVNGTLTFPTDADSTLFMDDAAELNINSGGTVNIGTTGTPVGAAYTAQILWDYDGGDFTQNIDLTSSGATFSAVGDPDYYDNTLYFELDADWTSGQTFDVVGDATGWPTGAKIILNKNADDFSNITTDNPIYTIDTIGSYDGINDKTPITIVEAAPDATFTALRNGWTSRVYIIDRNVKLVLGDDSNGTVYQKFDCATGADLTLDHVYIFAMGLSGTTTALTFSGLVLDDIGIGTWTYKTLTDCLFIRCANAEIGDYCTYDDCHAIRCSSQNTYTSAIDIRDNKMVFIGGTYGIYGGIWHGEATIVNCSVGCQSTNAIHGTVYMYNTTPGLNAFSWANLDMICSNVAQPITGSGTGRINLVSTNDTTIDINNSDGSVFVSGKTDATTVTGVESTSYPMVNNVMVDFTFNSTRYKLHEISPAGKTYAIESGHADFQTPDSGEAWVFLVTPDSTCSNRFALQAPSHHFKTWVESGDTTLTIKVYPFGWTSTMNSAHMYAEAVYISNATTRAVTRVFNSAVETYANGGWRSIALTIAPAEDSFIEWKLWFIDDDGECLIDPIAVAS